MTLLPRALLCGLLVRAAFLPAFADDKKEKDDATAAWLAEHYTKFEHRLPMRDGVMPARFRKSFERPEAMEPGKLAKVEFTMPDVLHTFRLGHRVMVQVQSTWFPLVARNPQTFVPNIAYAKPEDYRKATQRVQRAGNAASALRAFP